ncbi:MAG: type II toxin-antitoxin system VapB family antitoxin [Xanthobacteraceae bacterium]|nr:type II toxin-antitoxin system VapB family antitoxin [Xanthobacteraceae bacterium]
MALSLKDAETDALARQVAHLTGETLTEAVRRSLAERLEREQLKHGHKRASHKDIRALVERFSALPVLDDRTDDAIVGYDENGLPI